MALPGGISRSVTALGETVYSRFRKWIEDGFLDNIFRVLSLEAELEELGMDASIVKSPSA